MAEFEYEIEIDAAPDRVWHALRNVEEINRWHGWHFDGLAEEIDLIYFQDVKETVGEKLTLGDGDAFTLTDRDGRTILKMTKAPRGGNPEWDAYYDDVCEGWITFIQQLRFAVECHPGADRQTLFLNKEGSGDRVKAIFNPLDGLPAGAPYAITVPNGERLQGEIWYRSAHQVGITVAGWGDGLLVAGEVPVSSMHPGGGEMLVLTGYGDGFEEVKGRWQDPS